MKIISHAKKQLLLLTCMSLLASPFVSAEIVTTYQNSNKFTDFKIADVSQQATQRIFDRELKGSRVLELVAGEGRTLELDFIDINMAGYIDPFVGRFPSNSIRIIKTGFPPSLQFKYSLKDASGAVLAAGETDLVDLSLATLNSLRCYQQRDSFDLEMQLLEQWAIESFFEKDS